MKCDIYINYYADKVESLVWALDMQRVLYDFGSAEKVPL